MGGPPAGKTTIRKQRYSTGYVLVDAGEVFISLSRGEHSDFPGPFEWFAFLPTVLPLTQANCCMAEFLNPMGITQRDLADNIHVPYQRVNEIINGRRGITPSTALRLAKFFNMSADFWMNLQLRWD